MNQAKEEWKFEIGHAGQVLNRMDQERDSWRKAMDLKHAEYVATQKHLQQGWASLEERVTGMERALTEEKEKVATLEAQVGTLADRNSHD